MCSVERITRLSAGILHHMGYFRGVERWERAVADHWIHKVLIVLCYLSSSATFGALSLWDGQYLTYSGSREWITLLYSFICSLLLDTIHANVPSRSQNKEINKMAHDSSLVVNALSMLYILY